MRFSANLGFLWTDLRLPEAILAAGNAGFDAVEFHAPYAFDSTEVAAALNQSSLQVMSLNTSFGDRDGDFGVGAVPGREAEARSYIDQAITYATNIGCPAVHVTAGHTKRAEGSEDTYRSNLAYAAAEGAKVNITVLIEPISSDTYHLGCIAQGLDTIDAVRAPNLKLLVDCFHAWHTEPDLTTAFQQAIDHLGHVQFASVPDRHEPDRGVVDYSELLPSIVAMGYTGAFGAEYHPAGNVLDGVGWLAELRNLLQETKLGENP